MPGFADEYINPKKALNLTIQILKVLEQDESGLLASTIAERVHGDRDEVDLKLKSLLSQKLIEYISAGRFFITMDGKAALLKSERGRS